MEKFIILGISTFIITGSIAAVLSIKILKHYDKLDKDSNKKNKF